MLMRNTLPFPSRRFAAGIDVSQHEVRLVIVSRGHRDKWPVVEWAGAAPIAAGAVCGVRLVDRAAVSTALSSLCEAWPRRRAMRGMPCAMAVPGQAAGEKAECDPNLETRIETAAAAGIALAAVENEQQAALRALVHAAGRTLHPSARFAAIWAGHCGIHVWRVAEGAVRASIRFPGGAHDGDFDPALRSVTGNEGLERAVVGGDFAMLERVGLALADIGERLGCTAQPFDCASYRANGALFGDRTGWRRAGALAVAFGLALRGVSE